MTRLIDRQCAPLPDGSQPLSQDKAQNLMSNLSSSWEITDNKSLVAHFKFKNYYETQAFINAVAYIGHCEDHHPEISFGYNQCRIELTTHSVNGLSENDFIYAAKVDQLLTS